MMSEEENSRLSETEEADEGRVVAGVSADLEKHHYRNWVKGVKGLEYLQQGLAPFVDREFALQHAGFKTKLPKFNINCGCNLQNVLPDHDNRTCLFRGCLCKKKSGRRLCPNNRYCSTFCQLILTEHNHKYPLWKNSDLKDWPSDHWSIAKCYMTTKCPSNSAQLTDAAGLLSIIINARFFQSKVANPDVFTKARSTRNDILHNAKMELTDKEVEDSIDEFLAVLTDSTTLSYDKNAAIAVRNLTHLKAGKIVISMEDEEKILSSRKNAILVLKKIEEERMKIEEETGKSVSMIRKESTGLQAAVTSVKNEMTDAVKSFDDALEERKADVLASFDKAKASLEEKQTDVLESADKARRSLEKFAEEKTHKLEELEEMLDITLEAIHRLQQKETFAKEDEKYSQEKNRKDLRRKLTEIYKTHFIKTSVCPLKTKENDIVIHDVYVTPDLTKEVRKTEPNGSIELDQVPLNNLSGIFNSEGDPLHAIYIVGEVGSGKSAICKELMYKWCQSVDGKGDTMDTISEFEFMFYLPLRSFQGNDNVRQMIYSDYEFLVSKEALDDALQTPDKCFILMDGLDEWSPPPIKIHGHVTYGLPDARDLYQATVVTTSRASAPGVLNMKNSEYDQKIFLNGIKKKDLKEMVDKYISKLRPKSERSLNSPNKIVKEIGELNLGDLEKTPLLLQQIIWLLNEGCEIGNSISAVYSSMLNISLRWLEGKTPEDDIQRKCHYLKQTVVFPKMIEEFSTVDLYRYHISVMSEIAFDLLCDKCQSKTNFGRKYLERKQISEDVFRDILETGLLKKEQCNDPTQENTYYTFVHQSFFEYFAALYVASYHQGTDTKSLNNVNTLFRACKTVQDLLQLENVLRLISGLATPLICHIFTHIYHIAKQDTQYLSEVELVVKQKMPTVTAELQSAMETLLVRCLSERHCDIDYGRQEVPVIYLQLDPSRNQDNMKKQTLLLNYVHPKTVIHLHVLKPFDRKKVRESYSEQHNVHVSKPVVSVLQNIHRFETLKTIVVHRVIMSHDTVVKFSSYLAQTVSLTCIRLTHVNCADHNENNSCKHQIDLSNHTKLKILNILFTNVFCFSKVNTTHLECCITNQKDIIKSLTNAERLNEIEFGGLFVSQLELSVAANVINRNLSLTKITIHSISSEDERNGSVREIIDLLGHSELRHFQVTAASVLRVTNLYTANIEYCQTDNTDDITLLIDSPKLKQLWIKCSLNGQIFFSTRTCEILNSLSQLQELVIRGADIDDNALRITSNMPNLNKILLRDVKMNLPTWRTFLESLRTLKHTVHVYKFPADEEEKNYVRLNRETFQNFKDSKNALSFSL